MQNPVKIAEPPDMVPDSKREEDGIPENNGLKNNNIHKKRRKRY